MLEKVARALRENIKVDATGMAPAIASAYVVGIEDAAIAVVRAMREPEEAMLREGWPIYHPWHENAPNPEDRPEAYAAMKAELATYWRAMIDSILSQPQEEKVK